MQHERPLSHDDSRASSALKAIWNDSALSRNERSEREQRLLGEHTLLVAVGRVLVHLEKTEPLGCSEKILLRRLFGLLRR